MNKDKYYYRRRRAEKKAANICVMCTEPQADESKCYCPKHLVYFREQSRKRQGNVERYENAKSYIYG